MCDIHTYDIHKCNIHMSVSRTSCPGRQIKILNGPLYRLWNLLGTNTQNKLMVSDALELISSLKSPANRDFSKATRLCLMK